MIFFCVSELASSVVKSARVFFGEVVVAEICWLALEVAFGGGSYVWFCARGWWAGLLQSRNSRDYNSKYTTL